MLVLPRDRSQVGHQQCRQTASAGDDLSRRGAPLRVRVPTHARQDASRHSVAPVLRRLGSLTGLSEPLLLPADSGSARRREDAHTTIV